MGVFCTVVPDQAKGWQFETLASAKPVETDRADGAVSVLLAHVVSTRCCGETITDKDMGFPEDWRTRAGKSADVGNQETGRTIGLHSLAVAPKLHGCGLGKMIVKAYVQQMNNSGLADRVSLLCQDVRPPHPSARTRAACSPSLLSHSILSRTMSASASLTREPAKPSLVVVAGTTWYGCSFPSPPFEDARLLCDREAYHVPRCLSCPARPGRLSKATTKPSIPKPAIPRFKRKSMGPNRPSRMSGEASAPVAD